MISTFAIEVIKGLQRKVQFITYKNGRQIKRIYNNVNDTIPSEIEVISKGKTIDSLGYNDRFNSAGSN